jgi:uncharacterized repeat protein (TIGR01451 family)
MTNKFLTTLGLLLLLALPVQAADKGGIELKSTAEVEITVKNDQGVSQVTRVDAATAKVVPGDTVIFTTYYANIGANPATDIVIDNPLPEHMLYLGGSAEGMTPRIEFSVDHGKTFAAASKLRIKDAAGQERPATAADYTHIRWTMVGTLEKGAKGSVSFRAKVE